MLVSPPTRRRSRRKVKRSAVEIASKTFSEIRRIYAGEFEVYEERRLRVRSVPGGCLKFLSAKMSEQDPTLRFLTPTLSSIDILLFLIPDKEQTFTRCRWFAPILSLRATRGSSYRRTEAIPAPPKN